MNRLNAENDPQRVRALMNRSEASLRLLCRNMGLSVGGNRRHLAERIARYEGAERSLRGGK